MTRLLGFLIEGIAGSHYTFRIVLPDWVRKEAEEDLRTLAAEAGIDFSVHSPADVGLNVSDLGELVDFANRHVEVDGWLSIFPSFNHAAALEKPLAVIFPDAIPKTFHEFSSLAWGHNGNHAVWESYVREVVGRADRIVTFSNHVRDAHLCRIFNVDPGKVIVVPHASPDLAPMLPFVESGTRTPESVAVAASMLRDHAAERGWSYLRNYPFEQVPFVAVSTQDRVTKNIRLILDSVLRLVREDRNDLKILSTSPLHYGANWTVLPSTIQDRQAHRDFISMPDLPKDVHAAFFHCAIVAVHASIFEGGHAPFPFYEAVSVGTPCLMARGPHTEELIEETPELGQFLFDPHDADSLAMAIKSIIVRRQEVLSIQWDAYERLRSRSWSDVSLAYAEAAVLGPVAGVKQSSQMSERNKH